MRRIVSLAAGLVLLSLASQAGAETASVTRDWQFKEAGHAVLRLENLVGDLRVERGTAAGFHVSVKVTAEADSQAAAQSLAQAVQFSTRDTGSDGSFEVRLPKDRFPVIYRQGASHGWFGRSYVRYLGERRRISGDARDGVRIRVDILVRAPAEATLRAHNLLGDSTADGFSGDLRLDGTSGRLSSTNGSGKVDLDAGSGAVEVVTHDGEVRADTGSGHVTIRDCHCHVVADTGSGGVEIIGGEGDIDADTGSGQVKVHGFKGSVRADTGSGGVAVTGSSGARELVADTGSGGVSVSGDLSSLTKLDIDTGSGGVTLQATAWPVMEIVVDTGSGRKQVDVPGAMVTTDRHGRVIVGIGTGGPRGVIDTGSGSVQMSTVTAGD